MVRYQEMDWYQAPAYYDLVFSSLDQRECDFLCDVLAEYGPRRHQRRVLEPACGSGRLLERMAERDYSVFGLDQSAPMVDFARRRLASGGHRARVIEADMSDFRLRRRFDLAFCLVSSFRHLLSERAAVGHLRCVAHSLVHGGIYVLGFHLTDYHHLAHERERWVGERDETRVVCTIESWPADRKKRLEPLRSRLRVREGDATKAFESRWQFRTYDEPEARRLLAAVPELELVATYDMSYDMDREQELGSEQLDQVLILRRR